MVFVHRTLITVAAALAACALPAGRAVGQRPRPQPTRSDTVRKPPAAVSLDFQDQELKVVLDAIAAAGDLNVSLTNIPSQRVSVHLGRPVSREGMIELLKGVAESNGLKVTESPTLMQISGPAPERNRETPQQTFAQQLAQAQQAQQMRLYTYRLKHASAVQLAPVLTNLFSGFTGGLSGRATTTVIPNGRGGFTTITPPTAAGPPGNITTIPTPFGGAGGGGGGGGAGRAGPARAAAAAEAARTGEVAAVGGNPIIANAITNAFQQITGALSSQASDIRIIAEESSNSLLVRATEGDWALVQQIIQGVDLRPLQVLIEVTIAEVQRTHALDIGVSGTAKRTDTGKNPTNVSISAPPPGNARAFIAELTGGHGTVNYDVAIAALQERGDVRVLSLPVIIAQNNRQASLNVGSSRPFVQVSQTVPNDPTGRVQTVQYIDVGTVLTITPTINPDGYVNLQVTQTDNSATNEVQFDAPVINKREATTQIFIRDGQTTVIGGLAGNTHSSNVSGIPFLSRIPIIGPLLFGRVTRNQDTNELFLFLTPHVISNDEDVDKLRDAVKDGSDLLKHVNVGPHIVPKTDTLTTKPDSTKKDTLTTLRRRPPEPDTLRIQPWR
ncbi:MAG TPA: secretin N-terminal domain-containing protein [Gemmatimonadaceae bacterium]|nr:secretin N-terminal domain-containing protein [Gemmatimonadaceae bacterium]